MAGAGTAYAITRPGETQLEESPLDTSPGRFWKTPTRAQMLDALRRNHWRVTETARQLGMSRATFYRKMARLRIVAPNYLDGEERAHESEEAATHRHGDQHDDRVQIHRT